MRRLILALLPGLALACGDDAIATATADSTSDATSGDSADPTGSPTGSPTSSPTGSPTSDAPTTGNSESASDVTTDPTQSGSDPTATTTPPDSTTDVPPDTTGDTTADTTGDTTTDTTTGSGGACGADGPVVDAEIVHAKDVPACGPIEYIGQNQANNAGSPYMLDGCPCGANCLIPDPWLFTLDVPQDWAAGFLPKCPRIVVERQMSKKGCELVGVAIWDSQEPEGSAAVYHAGSLLGPIQAVVGQIGVEQVSVDECDCDNCCNAPTLLDLNFTALKSDALVSEGQTGMLGDADLGYEVINFQSHLSGICDDSPAIDWVARRVGKP